MQKLNINGIREKIIAEFKELFSGRPGIYNKSKIKIYVKENVNPITLNAKHVPYALKNKIENEILRLKELGHLESVETSDWATPIVPVIKSNGNVRICGDFKHKLTLNLHLVVPKHPFRRIDDIFEILQQGLTYLQLDLPHAYMQIAVEEESQKFLTITTHMGLFQYTKAPEGQPLLNFRK